MPTFILNKDQIETSEHLNEFPEMTDEVSQFDVSFCAENRHIVMLTDGQSIDEALPSLDDCVHLQQRNIINKNTTVSSADISTSITDSLNVNTKQVSLVYESNVHSNTAEPCEEENNDIYIKQSTDQFPTTNYNQQKQHIMISYNRSSIKTCRKIYNRLVERNYKVWIDVEHMFGDRFVGMARAVENSYIVLLCINQQYYDNDYCRLEAEYAAENRVKFIPCLMEEAFHPKSWLGIIKGSNVHIDFSSTDDFDQSFEQLIHEITFIEKRLFLQLHRTGVLSPMMNASVTIPNELSELIIKLRQELFEETTQSSSDEEEEEDNKQLLQQFVHRTLEQNDVLLKLVDRLARQKATEQNSRHHFDINGVIKVVLTVMLLWTLTIFCQKQ